MSNNFLQHYPDSQKDFVKRVNNAARAVSNKPITIDLGFCDPGELKIAMEFANRYVRVVANHDGGYDMAERQKVILSNYEEEIDLVRYEITYNQAYKIIEHPQILGTFINCGLDFDKFGDIIVSEDKQIQCIVDPDIAEMLTYIVTHIDSQKVKYNQIPEITIASKEADEKMMNVSSLRLDTIVKQHCKMARTKAQKLIKTKRVRHNYVEITDINRLVNEGDIISIRQYGRIKITRIEMTRKEKYKVFYQ